MSRYNPDDNEYADDDNDYDQDYASWDDRREKILTALMNRVNETEKRIKHEEELREKSPALQDAWEKYQIILRTIS